MIAPRGSEGLFTKCPKNAQFRDGESHGFRPLT